MKNLRRLIFLFLIPAMFTACRMFFHPMPQSTARQEASYRITISDQITNGKITVQDDIKSAEKGARITLIIKPDIYHKLATLIYTVNGASTDIYPRYNEAMQTCSITMPEGDMEIFGTFARQVHKLSIAVDPPEGGEVTSTPANTAITEDEVMADLTVNTGFRLKKDPDKGFDSFFAADTEGNVNWLEPPSDSFIMPDSDVTIYALLEKVYSVTIFTSDPSIANISLRNAEGAPASLFTEGESVSVSVNVLNNYYTLGAIRANWNTLGINGDGEVSKGFIMPQGDVILVATFVPNPANSYSIAIDSDIENGSITPQTENGTYRPRANADERIYLDIQPQPGYEISGLSVTGRNTGDEVAVSPGTSLRPVPSFMMPTEPVTVTGTFVRKYLYLTGTANPPEGGRVVFTSQGTQITRSRLDDNVTVRVTPETSPKYRIKTDGVSYIYTDDTKTTYTILLSGSSPYSLTMPAYDINVDAEFERLYSVTAEVPDASRGTLTITRQGGAETDEFAAGDTVRVYPIVTDDNYVIDTVTVSGMADPITNRFTMPARDVTVTLTFRLNSNILYKINQVAGSTGSVTPMTAAVNGNFLSEAPAGATAYLDIKAASGYEIDSLGYMINKAPPVVPIDKSGYPASRPSFKIPEMTSPFDTVDITASFVKINYNLKGIATLAGGGSGGGTVEFPGQGTPPKAQIGDAVTVLVTPKTSPKYRLNKVEISGGTASASIDIPLPGTSPYTTQIEMPAGDVTVNAEFARLYKVTKDVQDANGLPRGDVTIARQGGAETDEFAAGDTVRVYTSVTDENYVIDVITVSGISGAINNRFTMPAGDVTVTVTFKLNPALMYKVNGVTRSTGLVTPVTAGGGFLSEAPVGTTVFLDISPSPGYELGTLECWKNKTETPVAIAMNGYPGSLGARPSFEIPAMSLPTDTVDISATFVKINYDLTGIASITGGGTGGGTVKFFSGSTEISTAQIGNSITAEVSPSASPSYRLTKVEVNDGEKTVTHNVPLPGTSVFAVNNIQVLAHGVTVTAYFTRLYTVSLSAPPGSDGDVLIRNSAGVIVPGNEFAAGDTVMIETNPSTGYKLGAINVNQGVGTLTGNTFTMPGGNVTVTVTFTKITYTITPVTTANGTINAPSGAFYNDTVTLDPQPNAGYEISSLYYNAGSGNVTVSTSEKTFTMPDSNVTVGGSFTRKDLNLSVASFTGGSISGLPGTALLGNSVTFNVTPAAYYRHTAGNVTYSWSGGSGTPLLISQSGGTFTYRFTMPAYDTTVSAVFDPLYAVTVTSDPSGAGTATARNENGVITALFAEGDAVNIVVSITDSNYVVDTLIGDNGVGNITSTRSFAMPGGPVSVEVKYKTDPNQRPIIIPDTDNGLVRSYGSAAGSDVISSAAVTDTVYLRIQSNPGYKLKAGSLSAGPNVDGITMNGYPGTITARPYFEMPLNSVTVNAEFEKKDVTISAAALTGGAVTGLPPTAQLGNTVTFTVTPAADYRLVTGTVKYAWTGGSGTADPVSGTDDKFSFTMPALAEPQNSVTVSAEFARLYNVTQTVLPGSSAGTVKFRDSDWTETAKFAVGDTVNVDVTAGAGYQLGSISVNRGVGTLTGSSFTMPSGGDVTVTVTFNAINYTVSIGNIANGTVSASPTTATVVDTVNLTITPSPGYELNTGSLSAGAGVTINLNGYPGSPTAKPSFAMPARNVTVNGNFVRKTLYITPAAGTGGSITAPGTALVGDFVTFTVTPGANYRLKAGSVTYTWNGGSGTPEFLSQLDGTGTYRFTMPAFDTTVKAEFERLYTVTAAVSPSASPPAGTVAISNSDGNTATQFAAGDTVRVTPSAGTGYSFTSMNYNGNPISGNTFTMPAANTTVTAVFSLLEYSVSVSYTANGDISAPSQNATMGETVYLTIDPSPGYELDTASLSAGAGVTVTMNGYPGNPGAHPYFVMPPRNVTVSGSFIKKNLSLANTITPYGGGSVTGLPATAQLGDTVTFNVTPNANFRHTAGNVTHTWSGGSGKPVLAPGSTYTYSFTMPAYNTTVNAAFDPLYKVDFTASPSGSGTATIRNESLNKDSSFGVNDFAAGDMVRITPAPATGYRFVSMSYNGIAISGNTFVMPAGNAVLTAIFSLQEYSISIQPPANGDIGSSVQNATMGQTVYLEIEPLPGYELTSGSLSAGAGVTIAMNGYPGSPTARPSFTMPARNVTVNGAFNKKNLSLTSSVTPSSGGTLALTPSSGIAQVADPVTVTVTPASSPGGYYRLKSNGATYNYTDAAGTARSVTLYGSSPYSFNMPGYDTVVKAEFERLYTVTPVSSPAGSGILEIKYANGGAATRFAEGEMVTVLANPAEGYQPVSISVSGMQTVNGNSYTFAMPGNNVTVTAVFEKQKYSVYTVSDGNGFIYLYPPGAVTGASIITAEMDDKIMLEILPGPGYNFDFENLFCRTVTMKDIPVQTDDNGQYYFVMPANDTTVTVIFDKRTFTITTEVIKEPGDTESGITAFPLNPGSGELVIINTVVQTGYELVNLMYYLPNTSEGVEIDKYGTNSYAFSIPPSVANKSIIHVVAEFGIIIHKINVEPNSLDGGTFSFYDTSGKQITTANYNTFIRAYLVERTDKGYKYRDQSYKITTAGGVPVTLLSAVKDSVVQGRYNFTFNMPNASIIASAEYDKFNYNLIPAVIANGTVKTISQTSAVPIGTYITFIAEPNTGYRALQTGFSLRSGSSQVKSSSGFAPTGNPNEYGFNLDFTITQVPANGSTVSVSAQFALDAFSLAKDPGVTAMNISFSHSGNVLYDSTVTITLSRGYFQRYIPETVTLNGGADNGLLSAEVKNPDGSYTRTFKMPAKAVVVSAQSEPIPQATFDFFDPNLEKYMHFLSAEEEDYLEEIEYAVPGQKITVQAYPGIPSEGIIPADINSWWLDDAIQNSQTETFTVPAVGSARTVMAIVTIGGVPHSVSIPIRRD